MQQDPKDGGPTTESREEKRVEITEPASVKEVSVTETTKVVGVGDEANDLKTD